MYAIANVDNCRRWWRGESDQHRGIIAIDVVDIPHNRQMLPDSIYEFVRTGLRVAAEVDAARHRYWYAYSFRSRRESVVLSRTNARSHSQFGVVAADDVDRLYCDDVVDTVTRTSNVHDRIFVHTR